MEDYNRYREYYNRRQASFNSKLTYHRDPQMAPSFLTQLQHNLLSPFVILNVGLFINLSYKYFSRLPLRDSMRKRIDHVHAWSTETLQLLLAGALVYKTFDLLRYTLGALDGTQCVDVFCQVPAVVLIDLAVNILALYAIDVIEASITEGKVVHPYNQRPLILTRSLVRANQKSIALRRGRVKELPPIVIPLAMDDHYSEDSWITTLEPSSEVEHTIQQPSSKLLYAITQTGNPTTGTSPDPAHNTTGDEGTAKGLAHLDLAVSKQNLVLSKSIRQTIRSARVPKPYDLGTGEISSLDFARIRQEKLRLINSGARRTTSQKSPEPPPNDTSILHVIAGLAYLGLASSDRQLYMHIERRLLTRTCFAPLAQSILSSELCSARQKRRTSRLGKEEFQRRRAVWSPPGGR